MVLGNWFCVAWDIQTKKPLHDIARLETKNFAVEVHKNWLNFETKKGKHICNFYSGTVDGEFYVHSKSKDNLMVGEVYKLEGKGSRLHEEGYYFIIGYGYHDDEWVGCTQEDLDFFRAWFIESNNHSPRFVNMDNIDSLNQGSVYLSKKTGLNITS